VNEIIGSKILSRLILMFGLAVFARETALAQSEGYWASKEAKRWLFQANPTHTDTKWAQTLPENSVEVIRDTFDRVGTGQWLRDSVKFQWGMLDVSTGQPILPALTDQPGAKRLIPGQKVRLTATLNFSGQYWRDAAGGVLVGEPARQTPDGWRSATQTYGPWGFYTEYVVQFSAANNAPRTEVREFTVPRGPRSDATPLTILCLSGLGGYTAWEYIYEWVAPPAPVINAVTHHTSGQRTITPGSWFNVWGTNLAPRAREWAQADFSGVQLPTSLDGVQVLVNGKPSPISFISAGQINALAPTDSATGEVDVQVVAPNGAKSAVSKVTLARFAPGLFCYQVAGVRYVIAHAGPEFIARQGLVAGLATRPVRPDETITVYGTGFGPATQAFPPERIVSGYAPLANPVTFRIGGTTARVDWSGQVGSGLYQFNIQVPAAANGDQAIVAEIGGVASPAGTFITIQR
jgi:uncharacterized protein (TIGR03437 family)